MVVAVAVVGIELARRDLSIRKCRVNDSVPLTYLSLYEYVWIELVYKPYGRLIVPNGHKKVHDRTGV